MKSSLWMQKNRTAWTKRCDSVGPQLTPSLGSFWISRQDLNQVQQMYMVHSGLSTNIFPVAAIKKSFWCPRAEPEAKAKLARWTHMMQKDGIKFPRWWDLKLLCLRTVPIRLYSLWPPPKPESSCTANLRTLLAPGVRSHLFLEISRSF